MGEISDLLRANGFTFAHRLGQNFIFDPGMLSRIADAAGLQGHENVLEIGPGAGTLTRELATRAKKVVAVELDDRLLPVLARTCGDLENVHIAQGDILKIDIAALALEQFGNEPFCVVANLPYYITTPVLLHFLESNLPVSDMTVMVQKEVAARIVSGPGSKAYGALSVAVAYRAQAEIVMNVPAGVFTPKPKVDSSVVHLAMLQEPPVQVDEALFFRVVRSAFAMRRKTMQNNLCASFGLRREDALKALTQAQIATGVRGETLGLAQFAALSQVLEGILVP